ncbi:MAG: hypothetical protein H6Q72_3974 [Firmicutes bacterium]|nr:hypothetical protein [Bacillota bacterium]
MVMVCTPGKKFEGVEIKHVQFKLLITEIGEEYLLMYDFADQLYLYAVQQGEGGQQPEFTYIDKVTWVEEEPQRRTISVLMSQ